MHNSIINVAFGSPVRAAVTALFTSLVVFAVALFGGLPMSIAVWVGLVVFLVELLIGTLVFLSVRRKLRRAAPAR